MSGVGGDIEINGFAPVWGCGGCLVRDTPQPVGNEVANQNGDHNAYDGENRE